MRVWQSERARAAGVMRPPDTKAGKWSAAVAAAVRARVAEIKAAAGEVPDLGAVRAAAYLTRRLGAEVTGEAVEELARQGRLPVAGWYKDWPLYDGRALAAFTDAEAAGRAGQTGRLLLAAVAAARLRIRPSDFAHLARLGWLTPARVTRSTWDRWTRVPLYRAGDLDAILADPAIAWPAARATPRGRRSPPAHLPPRNPTATTD